MLLSIEWGRLKSHLKRWSTPRALRVASARSRLRRTSWKRYSATVFASVHTPHASFNIVSFLTVLETRGGTIH